MTTTKYGLEEMDYSVVDVSGIFSSAMQKIDTYLHTYVRLKVASGESIDPYTPVCVQAGVWKQAMDDGQRLPAVGISIETVAKGSGEWLRAQRCGPVTNSSGESAWAWSPASGEIWTNNSGELVQGVSGENWMNRQARIGIVSSATGIFIQL